VTLAQALREFVLAADPDDPPEVIAREFLSAHTKAELEPLVADEVVHLQRALTRSREAMALSALRSTGHPRTATETALAVGGITSLWGKKYRVGDGVERRFEEMRIEDWKARKMLLLGQLNGIQRSIAFCDQMMETLAEYGVSCAKELPASMAA